MATIVSTKTMTSLRMRANLKLHIFKLKILQLNRVKFSQKSYPPVGKAFVLNNPLYNLKISHYFGRNSMINLDKGRFPYWKYYRAFSLTWQASMLIYWNKRMHLHEKRVQLPEDFLGTPTWPPFHCFGTPIWPPWRHVKTLYKKPDFQC